MRLAQLLFSQGFGTRRVCAGLIAAGAVRVAGRVADDPQAEVDTAGLVFEVDGRAWPYHEQALILLHKPAGYECSQKPRHHPSVLSLLPPPLRARNVQPVGRLDEDTTGLLLLTDSGPLIHRLTSPKHHVPKVYEVGCNHAVSDAQLQALLTGVVLDDDPAPVQAQAVQRTGDASLSLTLTEGRYHQVKRMLAAVGNRVQTLHRSRVGNWQLPADLAPGGWRWLDLTNSALALTPSSSDASSNRTPMHADTLLSADELRALWQVLAADELRLEPYELTEHGEIVVSPRPTNRHQIITSMVAAQLKEQLGGLAVVEAAVMTTTAGIRVPDVVWMSMERWAEAGASQLVEAPDVVVEVLSPGNRKSEVAHKVQAYLKSGIREVIVVGLRGNIEFHGASGLQQRSALGLQLNLLSELFT